MVRWVDAFTDTDESIAARRLDPQQAFVMELPAGW
jgi:hypothetical protein